MKFPLVIILKSTAFVFGLLTVTAVSIAQGSLPGGSLSDNLSMGSMPLPDVSEGLGAYAAVGSAVAEKVHLDQLGWTEDQFNAFVSGLRASYNGQGFSLDATATRLFNEINKRIDSEAPLSDHDQRLARYLNEVRQGMNMTQTKSGLLIAIVKSGAGPRPGPGDSVQISFTAKSSDGNTDLPQLSGRHLRTKLSELLPGLAEGLRSIALGGKAIFVVPPKLTFAADRWPYGVEKDAPIWFQVDLEDILASTP